MQHKASSKGAGQFGVLFGIAVLVLVIYAAIKILPVYIKAFEFEDKVESTSRFAGAQMQITEDTLRDNLMEEAMRIGIPIIKEQIQVSITQNTIAVSAPYTVPIQFPGYTWTMKFNPSYSGQRFMR